MTARALGHRPGGLQVTAALDLEAVISVAEEAMERAGLAGRTIHVPQGHEDDPAYRAAMLPLEQWLTEVVGTSMFRRVYTSDYTLARAGNPQALVTAMGSIVTRPVTTEMTLLHECAHLLTRTTEGVGGHTAAFVETATRLYGRYLGPEAAAQFRRVVDASPAAKTGYAGPRTEDPTEIAHDNAAIYLQVAAPAGSDLVRQFAVTPAATDFFAGEADDLSRAYRDLPLADPAAVPLWQALGELCEAQAAALQTAYQIIVHDDLDPYETAEQMHADIDRGVYQVTSLHSHHPVWTPQTNVAFRIVHDLLGHGVAASDFSFAGEVQAYQAQCKVTPPHLWPVLFTEVIAQSAYANTHHLFGEQKVGLIPLTQAQIDAVVGTVMDGPDPLFDALHYSASTTYRAAHAEPGTDQGAGARSSAAGGSPERGVSTQHEGAVGGASVHVLGKQAIEQGGGLSGALGGDGGPHPRRSRRAPSLSSGSMYPPGAPRGSERGGARSAALPGAGDQALPDALHRGAPLERGHRPSGRSHGPVVLPPVQHPAGKRAAAPVGCEVDALHYSAARTAAEAWGYMTARHKDGTALFPAPDVNADPAVPLGGVDQVVAVAAGRWGFYPQPDYTFRRVKVDHWELDRDGHIETFPVGHQWRTARTATPNRVEIFSGTGEKHYAYNDPYVVVAMEPLMGDQPMQPKEIKVPVPWASDLRDAIRKAEQAAERFYTEDATFAKWMAQGKGFYLMAGSGQTTRAVGHAKRLGDAWQPAHGKIGYDQAWPDLLRLLDRPKDAFAAFCQVIADAQPPGYNLHPLADADVVTIYRGISLADGQDPATADKSDNEGLGKGAGSSWTLDLSVAKAIAERGQAGFSGDNSRFGQPRTVKAIPNSPNNNRTRAVVLRATVDLSQPGVGLLSDGRMYYSSEQEVDVQPGTEFTLTGWLEAEKVPVDRRAMQQALETAKQEVAEKGYSLTDYQVTYRWPTSWHDIRVRRTAAVPVGVPLRNIRHVRDLNSIKVMQAEVAPGAPLVYRNIGNRKELEEAVELGAWTAKGGGFTVHDFEGETQFFSSRAEAQAWSHDLRNETGGYWLLVTADITGLTVQFGGSGAGHTQTREQGPYHDASHFVDYGDGTGVFYPTGGLGLGVVGEMDPARVIKRVEFFRQEGASGTFPTSKDLTWREYVAWYHRRIDQTGDSHYVLGPDKRVRQAVPFWASRPTAAGHRPGGRVATVLS